MNIYQKIILILGAVALIVALWTSPKFLSGPGGTRVPTEYGGGTRDMGEVLVKSIGVIATTSIIFFVLKGVDRKKSKE